MKCEPIFFIYLHLFCIPFSFHRFCALVPYPFHFFIFFFLSWSSQWMNDCFKNENQIVFKSAMLDNDSMKRKKNWPKSGGSNHKWNIIVHDNQAVDKFNRGWRKAALKLAEFQLWLKRKCYHDFQYGNSDFISFLQKCCNTKYFASNDGICKVI